MLRYWLRTYVFLVVALVLKSGPALLQEVGCLVGEANCSNSLATSDPEVSQLSEAGMLVDDENACTMHSDCNELPAECLKCEFDYTCVYGAQVNVTCHPRVSSATCSVNLTLTRSMTCQFCYQTPNEQHTCVKKAGCHSSRIPRDLYTTNCTVGRDVLCLGSRTFLKNIECNWTSGYMWTTSMILSITLGGFGADRFYLGHWQEGMGKLFSFGGLGVWTLVDVVLIAVGYLKPADGSLYI